MTTLPSVKWNFTLSSIKKLSWCNSFSPCQFQLASVASLHILLDARETPRTLRLFFTAHIWIPAWQLWTSRSLGIYCQQTKGYDKFLFNWTTFTNRDVLVNSPCYTCMHGMVSSQVLWNHNVSRLVRCKSINFLFREADMWNYIGWTNFDRLICKVLKKFITTEQA